MRLHTVFLLLPLLLSAGPSHGADSAYTKLDLDNCQELFADDMGVSMKCAGYRDYDVYFTEGDLRQSVHYGPVRQELVDGAFESFAPFNYVNETIEWRLDRAGLPFAAIQRWFIENPGPDGAPTKETTGQVLVVSRVARPGDGLSCVVGYIDALANADANVLAPQVADNDAVDFACGYQERQWYGKRGEKSGTETYSWPEGLTVE